MGGTGFSVSGLRGTLTALTVNPNWVAVKALGVRVQGLGFNSTRMVSEGSAYGERRKASSALNLNPKP